MGREAPLRQEQEKEKEIRELAGQVLGLGRDTLMVSLRFLDAALAGLSLRPEEGSGGFATDGELPWYDSRFVLRQYRLEAARIPRLLLHSLLHCVFSHSFQYQKMERELWDMAADMAVENTVLELHIPSLALETDLEAEGKLRVWREDVGALTAERIYRYLKNNPVSPREREEIRRLFCRDSHRLWQPREELALTQEQWRRISQRIQTDLKAFTRAKGKGESLEKNLTEAVRERYDYRKILEQFTVMGEEISLDESEFDYIYYTYGLTHYGNLPLIEPLESRETRRVKEFVIAIDTSASCRGEVVRAFLNKTYSILKGTENFFSRVNVHIIQCDQQVRSDTKITCQEDFEAFLRTGKLTGFGGTDFRPVFDYVEELARQGEFENLKGLIYFTDGYGIYPERMPDFDVIFAFLDEDRQRAPVPPWSMKVILDSEE